MLYLLLLFTILVSGCSGKRYGHYRYSKKQRNKVVRFRKLKNINSSTLSFNKIRKDSFSTDTILKQFSVEGSTKNTYISRSKDFNYKKDLRNKFLYRDTFQLSSNEKPVAKPNVNADVSMALGIVSIFFGLFSILYLPLLLIAFILGLLAYNFAVNALQEIDDSPGKYSNKNAAIIGKVIGGIYLYAIILALAILALAILAGVIAVLVYMISVIA